MSVRYKNYRRNQNNDFGLPSFNNHHVEFPKEYKVKEGFVCEPGNAVNVTKSQIKVNDNSPDINSPQPSPSEVSKTDITLKYQETKEYTSTGNPNVWGPTAWFFFHTSAAHYPLNPSMIWKQRTKQFIQGIPVMLPCENCMKHATAFIESYTEEQLNNVVSSRENLFKFFWNFHNTVNKRLGKGTLSLENAKKIYDGTASVTKLTFG